MTVASSLANRFAIMASLLVAPSAVHAVQTRCAADSVARTTVIEGRVVDVETRLALHGANVTARWTDRDGRGMKRDVLTDRAGEFRICDAPADAPVSLVATWYGERSAPSGITGGEPARVVLDIASPHVAVSGRVLDAESGSPVTAASVRIGPVLEQLSDEDGAFRFEGIPPGLFDVTAERIGFVTVHDSVPVNPGTLVHLTVRLSTRAVPLEPVEVVVRSEVLHRAGFYEREDRGLGTFITRLEIERRPAVNSSDILRRVAGVRLVRDRFNDQLAIGRGNCPFRFIIDGTRINQGFSMDEMPPHWLEGIEVYNGLSKVPIQFAAGPSEPNADCGVIVIWTRNRR